MITMGNMGDVALAIGMSVPMTERERREAAYRANGASSRLRWRALIADPNRDGIVEYYLGRREIPAYRPILYERVCIRKRTPDAPGLTAEKQSTMFPGYVLTQLPDIVTDADAFVWEQACSVPGVHGLLRNGSGYAELDDMAVHEIRLKEHAILHECAAAAAEEFELWERRQLATEARRMPRRKRPPAPFAVGEEVRIPGNMFFRDQVGTIDKLDSHGRIEVLMLMFGHPTRVLAEAHEVVVA